MSQDSNDQARLPVLVEFAVTMPAFSHRRCGVVQPGATAPGRRAFRAAKPREGDVRLRAKPTPPHAGLGNYNPGSRGLRHDAAPVHCGGRLFGPPSGARLCRRNEHDLNRVILLESYGCDGVTIASAINARFDCIRRQATCIYLE